MCEKHKMSGLPFRIAWTKTNVLSEKYSEEKVLYLGNTSSLQSIPVAYNLN
jgi:hypothetical protein